jgi:hypothetical protein
MVTLVNPLGLPLSTTMFMAFGCSEKDGEVHNRTHYAPPPLSGQLGEVACLPCFSVSIVKPKFYGTAGPFFPSGFFNLSPYFTNTFMKPIHLERWGLFQ